MNCNLCATPSTMSLLQWCLFYQTNFRFTNDGNGGALYPSVPTGYTYYSDIATLQADYMTEYATPSFQYGTIADPLFNNPYIGDFTLGMSSPAKNLNYYGSYVGAASIGTPVKATISGQTGFDLTSNINLNIAEDSITLVDVTQNAQIDSLVIPNQMQREIARFPSYGFNADRNGQYIDSIPDLASGATNPGDVMGYPASYLVSLGAITYNGSVYEPGDRFTTVTGQTGFTTTASGVLYEIEEAPERHTIMARFGNGDSTPLTSASELTVGNWYYVSMSGVTYQSVDRPQGSTFKADSATTFSGGGTVTLAMSDEAFQHYEPGIQPTSNNVGDVRTGDIIKGNGDPNYVRGGLNVTEFPINAKYIQIRYQIKVNNLKP